MLKTEVINPKTKHIDKMNSLEIVKIMSEENYNAVKAVENCSVDIARAVDLIVDGFRKGGRLFYMGAGTSGRLGVLDASECPPTFGVDSGKVIGIIAGGDRSLRNPSENAEDNENTGVDDLKAFSPNANDTVVGISAAGGAKYVYFALKYAKSLGCNTIAVTSNENSLISTVATVTVCTDTGAEVIAGSTRLKAGTAQKLVLNAFTTAAMIQSGYVYENLMINLKPSNVKLIDRVIRIVKELTGVDDDTAKTYLDQNGWNIRSTVDKIKETKR